MAYSCRRSVLGRLLHSSHWPTILQSDTAASTGVRRRVVVSGWLQTTILALVSIASIVTPFGLYDIVAPAKYRTKEPFGYLKDDSAFGYGTPPRSDAPFTRVCGTDLACPGQTLNQTCNLKGNNCSVVYDPRIPASLRDLFSNGATTISSSVSSLFDIQWRSYNNQSDPFSILEWYLQDSFRQLSELIIDGKVEAIEGLIVDTVAGGIGFRNHTAPVPVPSLPYGSTWTEDILFIEPETQCVNLNITLDFILPEGVRAIGGYQNLQITDRGGLSGLSRIRPSFDTSPNGQVDLDLQQRAYNAAWLNNFMTLVYYNATDPDSTNITRLDVAAGNSFPLPVPVNSTLCSPAEFTVAYDAIMSSVDFGTYLSFNDSGQSSAAANPYGISQSNFSSISRCSLSILSSTL